MACCADLARVQQLLNPHGEEARSAVSNHEARLVPFILRDAATRLLRMRSTGRVGKAKRAHHQERDLRWHGGHASLCPPYGTVPITRSQYAYPSRSTRSPDVTASRRENIGPATTQV